jgi:hypothetical protein
MITKAVVRKSVKGEEILPRKDGSRTLVYPACGTDSGWIKILKPDKFVGIDLDNSGGNPFDILGCKSNSVLYLGRDARSIPEIPKSEETVLLLKVFWGIGNPYSHSVFEDPPLVTEEMHREYQEENIRCLIRYLKSCEKSAAKKTFVVDADGYEPVITSQGYHKILSHEPSCNLEYPFCNFLPCEVSMPLFDWKKWNNEKSGYACPMRERITITSDEGNYPITLPILSTYVKDAESNPEVLHL